MTQAAPCSSTQYLPDVLSLLNIKKCSSEDTSPVETKTVPLPCVQPGGSLFITTINKTNLSYALGIVVAEQLLRIVPSGTHDWEKFISPVELERLLESSKSIQEQKHTG